MDFTPDQNLSMLVYSDAKIGKTTLAMTSPAPILVLDVDGEGTKFLKEPKISWDPQRANAPIPDGTWRVCVVIVRDWQTVQLVYQHLTQRPHGFTSLVIDSITELQSLCRKNIKGSEAMQQRDWGVLLATMDDHIHWFRDLVRQPDTSLRCVVFIAESKTDNHRARPRMQGQVADRLPYWTDAHGYLHIQYQADSNGQPTIRKRCLGILPTHEYDAGSRFEHVLPSIISDPDITQIMINMYKETTV